MQEILLVEDSNMFGKMTKAKIENQCNAKVTWTKTLADTKNALQKQKGGFSLALLDLNLPDAHHGEIVDLVVDYGITSFVFTGNLSDAVREQVWKKEVADYILKDDPNSITYIINAINRIQKNEDCLVLVVDDSSMYRNKLSELLQIQKYRVLTAPDAKNAMEIINKYPEINLVLTDFEMPQIDGCILCQKIRSKFSMEEMAIIGLSSSSNKSLGAKFIKNGANDFIVKDSFMIEEFYCRVNQCIDIVNNLTKFKDLSIKDYLTGLYNRRYFYEHGEELFKQAQTNKTDLFCAMLDIDSFKTINDKYGHAIGDLAIQHISKILKKTIADDAFVARIGGEEFCILGEANINDAKDICELIRKNINNSPLMFDNKSKFVQLSVSIGIADNNIDTLEHQINKADRLMYLAKNDGKNCINI